MKEKIEMRELVKKIREWSRKRNKGDDREQLTMKYLQRKTQDNFSGKNEQKTIFIEQGNNKKVLFRSKDEKKNEGEKEQLVMSD